MIIISYIKLNSPPLNELNEAERMSLSGLRLAKF